MKKERNQKFYKWLKHHNKSQNEFQFFYVNLPKDSNQTLRAKTFLVWLVPSWKAIFPKINQNVFGGFTDSWFVIFITNFHLFISYFYLKYQHSSLKRHLISYYIGLLILNTVTWHHIHILNTTVTNLKIRSLLTFIQMIKIQPYVPKLRNKICQVEHQHQILLTDHRW